jgi:ATP-dependent Clp protease adaptor protein ClpS
MATKQDQAGTSSVEVAPERPKARPETTSKPKMLPPYAVILLNDDHHTMQYVVEALQKTFGYSTFKALRLVLRAHVAGRALVWVGSKEVAEFKRERLRGFGPDIYATREVNFPLGCEIEPMPQ